MSSKGKVKTKQNTVSGKTSVHSLKPTNTLVWLMGILIITFIAFSPVLKNGFTNWDDNVYIGENPLITSISGKNIKNIFSTDNPVALNYHPISILSFAIDYKLSGYNPRTFHITNLLIHLLNTALVFWFIFLLSRKKVLVATIVALFFGIHPMHVESVAWVAERKDVMYVLFFMAALICYYKYIYADGRKKMLLYIITMVLFLASILSKAMAVVLPMILLLIDYYENRKFNKNIVLEKAPFFILSLYFGSIAYHIQSQGAAVASLETFSWLQRFQFASYGILNYIFKLIAPFHLSCFYPYPRFTNEGLPVIYFIAPLVVLALFVLIFWRFRQNKNLIFGFLFFCITIALVLQFITVGKVIMADRYSYLAFIGLLFTIAMSVDWIQHQQNEKLNTLKKLILPCIILAAFICAVLTYKRTKVWENSDTLWTDAIRNYPNSEAYQSRASYLVNKSRIDVGAKTIEHNEYDRAFDDYSNSIKWNPNKAEVFTGRANLYCMKGQFDKAFEDYEKAIALNDNNADAYFNRAGAYSVMQQYDKAIIDYNKALTLNPNLIQARQNRSYVYVNNGEYEKGIAELTTLIMDEPYNANNYFYRSFAYFKIGKLALALEDNTTSIQLNPNNSAAYMNRSFISQSLGKINDAINEANKAASMGYQVNENYLKELQQQR
jgi:tetratricopeptide (TPR) repeat protein